MQIYIKKNTMETKNEIQEKAVQAILDCFMNKRKNALVTAATGVGKTKIAFNVIKDLVSIKPDAKVLIVVPTEILRDEGWKEEALKWGFSEIWDKNIERVCYASLNKISNKTYNLVILDEIQNITKNNTKFFFNNNNITPKILGLTATLPEEFEKKILLHKLNLDVCFEVPIDKAIKDKLISPYEITVIKTTLDNLQPTVKFTSGGKPYYLTEEVAYKKLTKSIEFAKMTNNFKKIDMLIFARMRVIYNSINKTIIANHLLSNYIDKEEKTLIFCGSIKQAEILCPYTYHSKSSDKDLIAFKQGTINKLSCVNALNEGHNIPNIDNAIITQVTSKERHLVQRVGRIIRYRVGHIGKIYIIVLKDTVDEQWLQKALENIENLNIKELDINPLKITKV